MGAVNASPWRPPVSAPGARGRDSGVESTAPDAVFDCGSEAAAYRAGREYEPAGLKAALEPFKHPAGARRWPSGIRLIAAVVS